MAKVRLTLEFAGDNPEGMARRWAQQTDTEVSLADSPNGNVDVVVTGSPKNVLAFAKRYNSDDGENLFNEFAVEVS